MVPKKRNGETNNNKKSLDTFDNFSASLTGFNFL